MPLYEYQCKKCKHTFEKIQSFSDPPIKKCPQCGGSVEKLLSAPAVQFKGTGWYVTDYASKGKAKPAADAPAAGSTTETAKTESASDSQPAKAETKKSDSKKNK
jgi:putative FmdB family regulatory protein